MYLFITLYLRSSRPFYIHCSILLLSLGRKCVKITISAFL